MKFDFHRSLRKNVKKVSLITAGQVDCETPKETQIKLPTTVTVSSCCNIGNIISLGSLEKVFFP